MANTDDPLRLRVFLASPGDVAEERASVHRLLERVLPKDPGLEGRIAFELVSWNDPDSPTPLPAGATPQDAVIRFKGRPAECDVVVVILASRIGTHLDVSRFRKSDGSAYASGTEWEYEDAWNTTPRPEILVYRRNDVPPIDPRAPDAAAQFEQFRQVDTFFGRFKNADGSWGGGFDTYHGVEEFRSKFEHHVRRLVAERLQQHDARSKEVKKPAPDPPPALALPTPPDLCLGRDADTALLLTALRGPQDATAIVLGQAGIGKTTLTRKVAASPELAARFGDRRWFVALETALDRAGLRERIVVALGGNPAEPIAFDHACRTLAEAAGLLVLDNLETPWEAEMPGVQDDLRRLAAIPGLSLLASLRGTVPPDSPAFTRRISLDPLTGDPARTLFLTHAPNILSSDPHLADFLGAVGGIPLAIELVARRAARHPEGLAELWDQYQARGPALARHPHLPEGRLTSVIRSIDLSWQSSRLQKPGRRLFRLLGASPAGLARTDREALLGQAALEAAEQVLEVGLAIALDGRLDLLPPVRGYAQAMQPPGPEELDRWCRHFLARVEALGDLAGKADSGVLIERLTPEVPNLEAAFAAALTPGHRATAVGATFGHHVLLVSTGLGRAAPLQALAEACRKANDILGEAKCIERLGYIALSRSQQDAARTSYERALPLFRQAGHMQGEATCTARLGEIALARSQYEAARTSFERVLPLLRQAGDVQGEANCILRLGDIALRRSQHNAARAAYEQALPIYRQVGDVLGEANCIKGLGDIALWRADHDAARAAYERALPLYRQVGGVPGEANCIKGFGDIALALSDHDAARAAYEQALPLYRQVGDVLGEANCIKRLGDIAQARSQHDAARAAYEQTLPLYRQVGDVLGEANCIQGLGDIALRRLGDIALRRSDLDTARAAWQQALALYARIPHPYSIGCAHHRLAQIATGAQRAAHIEAARQAWTSIDRPDLLARLDKLG